jgi:hypothetical protein
MKQGQTFEYIGAIAEEEYKNKPIIEIGRSFQPLLKLSNSSPTLNADEIKNARCSI